MSHESSRAIDVRLLQESIGTDYIDVDIRLRKGNYQYDLARSIASFQLELHYPDVKDLVERLYGEEKVDDQQFVRKIQTILKKMERNGVVRILPKRKPWELQRYALSSFKFIDVDKKSVVLATPEELEHAQDQLGAASASLQEPPAPYSYNRINALMLTSIIVVAFTVVLWSMLQPIIQLIAFVPAFCVAVACSVVLGEQWARGRIAKS